MSLFSKFTKSHNNEKSIYPWSQRKLSGSNHALPRFGHGATMLDNQHFIIFGGIYTKGNTKKNLFIIDTNNISATSLSTSGDIPSARSFTTITSIGGFVLLYGGEPIIPGEIWDPYFYVLHTNTRQWSRVRTKGRLPSERAGHSTCVSKDGIMYIWGGHYQRRYLNDLCAFNVKEYPSKAEWEFISYENQGPSPRSGHVSVIYDNKLYIFGGVNAGQLYNDIWYFDLDIHVWHQIAAVGYIPVPRESCAAALVDDTIYIFGGRGLNGSGLGDLCAYRIQSKRWYTFENMGTPPSPRYGLTLTVVQNKIYVFGGESISGKTDDGSHVYILDCSKIKYRSEPESLENKSSNVDRVKSPQLNITTNNNLDSPISKLTSQSPPLNTRQSPTVGSPIIDHHRPLPSIVDEDQKLNLPVTAHSMESNTSYNRHDIAPPRPPREGATLGDVYHRPMDPSLKFRRESIQPPLARPHIPIAGQYLDPEEKNNLTREIVARDVVITEMQKKEQWWRTEVSIARYVQGDSIDDEETKHAMLMKFDEKDNETSNEKIILFKQLVNIKSEIKKIKTSITKQTDPLAQKMEHAENIRTIALEEAAYYKAKYNALKTNNRHDMDILESDRVQVLEKRLADAYEEKILNEKSIHHIEIQSNYDKAARLFAEERARDAQLQSEEAQEAHQEALEKLSLLYQQITKAEAQGRSDALVIADLSNQVAENLSIDNTSADVSQVHIEMGRLEAANIKLRNEMAILLQKLEQSKDDEINLRSLLNERDEAHTEAILELEKTCIQLELLKSASHTDLTSFV